VFDGSATIERNRTVTTESDELEQEPVERRIFLALYEAALATPMLPTMGKSGTDQRVPGD